MRLIFSMLGLLIFFVVLNFFGFLLFNTGVPVVNDYMYGKNGLILFKTFISLFCSFYISYVYKKRGEKYALIIILLVLLYVPIFFGVNEGSGLGQLAWPVGFVMLDFFSLIGMLYFFDHWKKGAGDDLQNSQTFTRSG